MGTLLNVTVVCGLLIHSGMARLQPSVESMTFQVETVDRTEEFSIRATSYFSVQHEAYRYDFGGGSQLFVYPKKGQSYYYYPTSNFPSEQYNITRCYSFSSPLLKNLPSPLPSLEGFSNAGTSILHDTSCEKYEKIDEEDCKRTDIWVEKLDPETGINLRPVRKERKQWLQSADGVKEGIELHTITEYFGFTVGEQHSSVWDTPDVLCQGASENTYSLFLGMGLDLSVPEEILPNVPGYLYNSPCSSRDQRTPRNHARGRRSRVNGHSYSAASGNTLAFPYTLQQCKSLAKNLPKSFDWRNCGAVTPVKNQRNCGSCWAFGTVGSLEGAYFLKHNELVELSEQAMVDCAGSEFLADGCFGGYTETGLDWVKQTGGIPPTEAYASYQEANGYCRVNDTIKLVAQLEGYYSIPSGDTDALKVALVNLGPIAVGIDASRLSDYNNGVIIGEDCEGNLIDHVVLLVGYGESAEHGPYWIIKNSWGTAWGLEGYFLISAKGDCLGILDDAVFPVLK